MVSTNRWNLIRIQFGLTLAQKSQSHNCRKCYTFFAATTVIFQAYIYTYIYILTENLQPKKHLLLQLLNFLYFYFQWMIDYLDLRQNVPSPFKNGLLDLCTDILTVVAFFTSASNDNIIITEKKRQFSWPVNPWWSYCWFSRPVWNNIILRLLLTHINKRKSWMLATGNLQWKNTDQSASNSVIHTDNKNL